MAPLDPLKYPLDPLPLYQFHLHTRTDDMTDAQAHRRSGAEVQRRRGAEAQTGEDDGRGFGSG